MVSSDAPARGHPLRLGLLPNPTSFKSCPREGASPDSYQKTIGFPFQVIPREGASKKIVFLQSVVIVSSHSPARGHPSLHWASFLFRCFKSFPREGALP